MPLQIANPSVVDKIERLAKASGLNKTAVVERAVDRLLRDTDNLSASAQVSAERFSSLLAQIDRVPDRPDAADPREWDAAGLPR